MKVGLNQNKTNSNSSISNCLYTSKDGKNCLQCEENFFYYNNKCVIFCPVETINLIDNQICLDRNCTKKDCVSCDLNGVCNKCLKGFYLNNGTCIDKCPKGLYADRKTWTCHNDIESSLFYVSPSRNSCKNYCGKNFTISGGIDCSCDSSCFQIGNCCEDYLNACRNELRDLNSKNKKKSLEKLKELKNKTHVKNQTNLINKTNLSNQTDKSNITHPKSTKKNSKNQIFTNKTKNISNHSMFPVLQNGSVMSNHNESIKNFPNFSEPYQKINTSNFENYQMSGKSSSNYTKKVFQEVFSDSFFKSILNSIHSDLYDSNENIKGYLDNSEITNSSEDQTLQNSQSKSNNTEHNLKYSGQLSLTLINGNHDVKIINQNIKNSDSYNTFHFSTGSKK